MKVVTNFGAYLLPYDMILENTNLSTTLPPQSKKKNELGIDLPEIMAVFCIHR